MFLIGGSGMTENEAIRILGDTTLCMPLGQAAFVAIESMKKLQQYQAIGTVEQIKKLVRFLSLDNDNGIIKDMELLNQYKFIGTVEECREARERQRAEKTGEPYINGYGNKKAECLNCHCTVMYPAKYCKFCGQKLDWKESS